MYIYIYIYIERERERDITVHFENAGARVFGGQRAQEFDQIVVLFVKNKSKTYKYQAMHRPI